MDDSKFSFGDAMAIGCLLIPLAIIVLAVVALFKVLIQFVF